MNINNGMSFVFLHRTFALDQMLNGTFNVSLRRGVIIPKCITDIERKSVNR